MTSEVNKELKWVNKSKNIVNDWKKNFFYHFQQFFSHLICSVQVALEPSLYYSFTYLQIICSDYIKYQSIVTRVCFHPSREVRNKQRKLSSIFILTLLCGASKAFTKSLKAFMKPFEAPQRSAKIKI